MLDNRTGFLQNPRREQDTDEGLYRKETAHMGSPTIAETGCTSGTAKRSNLNER